jgi:anti-sigma B factor antagonist
MVTWTPMRRSVEDVPGASGATSQDLSARIVGLLYFSLNTVADPPQLRVVVTGELDVLSVSGLRGAVARGSADGCSSVVIDLEGVTFIDCTGLSALLACQQEVAASGGTFSVAALSAAVSRVVELTGTSGRFDTMTLESA